MLFAIIWVCGGVVSCLPAGRLQADALGMADATMSSGAGEAWGAIDQFGEGVAAHDVLAVGLGPLVVVGQEHAGFETKERVDDAAIGAKRGLRGRPSYDNAHYAARGTVAVGLPRSVEISNRLLRLGAP